MAYAFEDIKDSVVVITGSGRGIGLGMANLFASHGAKVVISDIDADVCKEAEKAVAAEHGVETLGIVCDVTNKEKVDEMFKQIKEKWGKVDCLINNAGITKDGLFLRMKPQDLDIIMKINVAGTFYCAQAAANIMRKERKGNIINLSSIARYGSPGQTNYSASKAAVVGFTKALAKEIAGYGIRVNCIAPGFVETRLTDAIPDKIRDDMIARIPMKRTAQPEDMANVALFLASELSGYITGQVIDVDGGLT